jgi:hypothetical protein
MDLSNFGMLVEAERALEPGTVVSVETNSVMLGNACVRYCTPSLDNVPNNNQWLAWPLFRRKSALH